MFNSDFMHIYAFDAEECDSLRSQIIDREQEFFDWFNSFVDELESADLSIKLLQLKHLDDEQVDRLLTLRKRLDLVKQERSRISDESLGVDARYIERDLIPLADDLLRKLTGDIEDLLDELKEIQQYLSDIVKIA